MSSKRKYERSQFRVGMTGDEVVKFIKSTPWKFDKAWWKEPPDKSVKGSGIACQSVSHPTLGERTLTFFRGKPEGPYLLQEIEYPEKEKVENDQNELL